MRITDLPVSTPLTATSRATSKKAENGGTSNATVLQSAGPTQGLQHPDELAAAALQKAAASATSTRLVAAQNQLASASVSGDIDPRRAVS